MTPKKQVKNMGKICRRSVPLVCLCLLLITGSAIGCAAKTAQPAVQTRQVTVQRGNLATTISVDGNLTMPQAYVLRFGAPGNVKDVLVKEGDFVKAGQVLARLDDTPQRLAVRTSNNNVQTVLSNLYETVPRLPQFPSAALYSDIVNVTGAPVITIPNGDQTYLDNPTLDCPTVPSAGTTTVTTTAGPTQLPGNMVQTVSTQTQTTTSYVGGRGGGPVVVTTGPGIPTTIVHTVITTTTTTTTALQNHIGSILGAYDYYPNAAAWTAFAWAQDEVYTADALSKLGNYTAAASQLDVAVNDLELCLQIFDDAINNPQSGLGDIVKYIPEDMANFDQTTLQVFLDNGPEATYILELRALINSIKQSQVNTEAIVGMLALDKPGDTGPLFQPLLDQLSDLGKSVISNINIIKSHSYTTIYGEAICLYLYGASADALNKASTALSQYGLDSTQLNGSLLIAQHTMEICNSILGTNDYVLKHGLTLQAEQQYKIQLQNALVNLENQKSNFVKTVILAPFDGYVVSVGFKKNDVVSQITYSSGADIELVDTTAVRFEGLVDEIDITKVKTGQKANIAVDAVPNKTFTGTVSFISPYGTPNTSGVVQFTVYIQLDPTDVDLKGTLSATADITVANAQNLLLVTVAAVTTTSAGSFVTVVTGANGQTQKRQVTLGQQNSTQAEVLSGLKEGDKVVIEQKTVVGAPVFTPRPGGGGGFGGGGGGGGARGGGGGGGR